MDNLDNRKKALSMLMGDMDDIEGKGMFPEGEGEEPTPMSGPMGGVDVTISVSPQSAEGPKEEDESPEGDTLDGEMGDDEMRGLPPFLRKAMNKGK